MHTPITEALERRDADAARQLAEQAVEKDPGDWQAQRLLALALSMQGNIPAAHVHLDQAIALAPHEAMLHVQRATLLLAEARFDDVTQALQHSVTLDPNTLPAYLMRAQLALRAGDLDTADTQARLAARLDAGHPALLAIQGVLALQRRQAVEGLRLLNRAVQLRPEHPQTLYALALAYLANGHHAFAEQSLRRVVELLPAELRLRQALADLVLQQGRPDEAADILADVPDDALTPDGLRLIGELRLAAGQTDAARTALEQALQLRNDDPRLIAAWLEALRRQGDVEAGVEAVESLLLRHPDNPLLWSARLQVAPDADAALRVVERWQQAMPDAIEALDGRFQVALNANDTDTALDFARQLIRRRPLHLQAQAQVLDHLFKTDPAAAVSHVQSLQALPADPATQAILQGWLAHACDRADRPEQAVAAWLSLNPSPAKGGIPLPPASGAAGPFPALGKIDAGMAAQRPMFLHGSPGSAVERIAAMLDANSPIFRGDRLHPPGVEDGLRSPEGIGRLADEPERCDALMRGWRDGLTRRGIADGAVIDWLPWWDNALLHALCPQLPQGVLLLVQRDPRQMLLDWLSAGTAVGFELEDPGTAARWLAVQLQQQADLIEGNLYPHIRFDPDVADINDVRAQCAALGQAIGAELLPPAPFRTARLPAGRWRAYASALGEAFAVLQPVAMRLGYPAD